MNKNKITKEMLNNKIIELEDYITVLKRENKYLEGECKHLMKSMTTVGKTCYEVYKCYPHILGECCTEPELITLFKVQDAF